MKILTCLLLILVVSCGKRSGLVFEEKLTPNISREEVNFAALKSQVLEPHCLTCHSRMGTEEAISRWVTPGDPEKSRLFKSVESGSMPKNARPLGTRELELIRSYITKLAAPEREIVTFDDIKAQILVPSCLQCHRRMDNETSLSTWINRENPTQSKLYLRVIDGSMPKGGSPLSSDQTELILNYIQDLKRATP